MKHPAWIAADIVDAVGSTRGQIIDWADEIERGITAALGGRDARIASLEAQLENARRLLQISDERVTRLSGKADELEDGNHHLGEQNYILTGRVAELELARRVADAAAAVEMAVSAIERCIQVEHVAEMLLYEARDAAQSELDAAVREYRAALEIGGINDRARN